MVSFRLYKTYQDSIQFWRAEMRLDYNHRGDYANAIPEMVHKLNELWPFRVVYTKSVEPIASQLDAARNRPIRCYPVSMCVWCVLETDEATCPPLRYSVLPIWGKCEVWLWEKLHYSYAKERQITENINTIYRNIRRQLKTDETKWILKKLCTL